MNHSLVLDQISENFKNGEIHQEDLESLYKVIQNINL